VLELGLGSRREGREFIRCPIILQRPGSRLKGWWESINGIVDGAIG
jgi:hypothetical protein